MHASNQFYGVARYALLASVAMLMLLASTVALASTTKPTASVQTTSTTMSSCQVKKVLTVGSSGADVLCLQTYLQSKGYLAVAPTGYFGPVTKVAVTKWQLWAGLPNTGYFGILSQNMFNIR